MTKKEHISNIMSNAVKIITGLDDDDDSKIAFLVDFALEKEGKKFIAEHLFGKAPQQIDNTHATKEGEQLVITFSD